MKKRQHKIGTTILLALAPACALGVTLGVVATSKQVDVEKEVTADEWDNKFKKVLTEYTSTYNTYAHEKVRFIMNGVEKTNFSFETYIPPRPEEPKVRSSDIRCPDVEPTKEHKRICVAGGLLQDEIDTLKASATSIKYYASNSSMRILITEAADKYDEYTINNNGYVTKLVRVKPTGTNTYEIYYSGGLGFRNEITLKPFAAPVNAYSYHMQLKANTTYSINIPFDPANGIAAINSFRVADVEKDVLAGIELASYDISPSTIDWEYKEISTMYGYGLIGTAITTKTNITIKFKVANDIGCAELECKNISL